LTELGKVQAIITGKRLSEVLKNRNVRVIYHSNMPRAKQTAIEIAKFFPNVALIETPLLAEAIPAEPDPPSSNCPEFEPEEGKRLEGAYRTFFARPIGDKNDSVDILVGHGNCFRLFVCRTLQIDPRYWLRMAIYNCGISRIELFKSGRVSVRGVGDIGHIPAESVTYS
jgi:serine/threonine-protein phosphatase PGAM5